MTRIRFAPAGRASVALGAAAALLLGACTVSGRQHQGPAIAETAGWSWTRQPAGPFTVASATRPGVRGEVLVVYIEGDGLAYARPGEPALDPTPSDPIALRLATTHPGPGPVAYLARPCQFDGESPPASPCRTAYWTGARLAPEIVAGMSSAIDRLKAASGASRVVLAGYSGGGALAALLAERRDDVAGLLTVAANLDLAAWTAELKLAPLAGSLDPATGAASLSRLPQVHFYGDGDKVVPAQVGRAFLARMPSATAATLVVVPGQDHGCCWAASWPALARREELRRIPGWL